jgi:hypothetical protein
LRADDGGKAETCRGPDCHLQDVPSAVLTHAASPYWLRFILLRQAFHPARIILP